MTEMTEIAPMTVEIELAPTSKDYREFYGMLFESAKTYAIKGRGVHNSGSQHKIQVWMSKESRRTDDLARTSEPVYRSCNGDLSERGALTFQTSAQSSVISSARYAGLPRDERGEETLRPGDVLDLGVFGKFVLTVKSLHDPILVAI